MTKNDKSETLFDKNEQKIDRLFWNNRLTPDRPVVTIAND